ncbi:MAG: hypothetical protein ABMB14_01695, partial [Myxococcota bacterium]
MIRSVVGVVWLIGCTGPVGTLDTGTPGTTPPAVPGLVAASTEDVVVGWPDVVIDATGRVWVTYTTVTGADEIADVHLTWSDDGGQRFAPSVVVDDVDSLFLGTVRQPILAVNDERVAIVVGGGDYRASTILLYTAPVSDPSAITSMIVDSAELGLDKPSNAITLVDQPELAFDTAGQLIVTWKRGTKDEAYGMMIGW